MAFAACCFFFRSATESGFADFLPIPEDAGSVAAGVVPLPEDAHFACGLLRELFAVGVG